MSNIIFSMIPFILFSFICVILTMRRYSKTVTRVVWAVLVGAVSAVHLAIGIALPDHAFLIALMPVTAYLPVIIAVFVLSKRSFTGNVFVISVALLACVPGLSGNSSFRSVSTECGEMCSARSSSQLSALPLPLSSATSCAGSSAMMA